MAAPPERVRLDKWLWAARFFKARSLAAIAVDNGKVHINGQRAKPAKDVKAGDTLTIVAAETTWTVLVQALSEQRGPAAQAQQLYAETEESRAAREAARSLRKYLVEPAAQLHGRPTKKDRRILDRYGRG